MSKQHTYRATVEWTGNLGSGTSSYTAYSRDYTVQIAGKPDLFGSSDPAFRGDEHRHNPKTCCWPPFPPATNSGTCTCAAPPASPLPPTPIMPKP